MQKLLLKQQAALIVKNELGLLVVMIFPSIGQFLYSKSLEPGPRVDAETWVLANLQRLSVFVLLSAVAFSLGFYLSFLFKDKTTKFISLIWSISLFVLEISLGDFGTVSWSHGLFNLAAFLFASVAIFCLISIMLFLLWLRKRPKLLYFLLAFIFVFIAFPRVIISYAKWPLGLWNRQLDFSLSNSSSCAIERPVLIWEYLISPFMFLIHNWWALLPCKSCENFAQIEGSVVHLNCFSGEVPSITLLPYTQEPFDNQYKYVQSKLVTLESENGTFSLNYTGAIIARCGERANVILPQLVPRYDLVMRNKNKANLSSQLDIDIILIYLDATSRASIFRNLPKTMSVLSKFGSDPHSSSFVSQFFKASVHSANTPANSRALFTGDPEPSQKEFLWETLSKVGFVTAITDNTCAEWAKKYGGRSSPTDFSMNSLWCLYEYTKTREDNYDLLTGGSAIVRRCLLGHQVDELVFSIEKNFLSCYQHIPSVPTFSIIKFSEGHEITSSIIRTIDDNLSEFISSIDTNRSVVILYSDHGIHFGPFWTLKLHNVVLENQLPGLFFMIPKRILPERSKEFLLSNEQSLVVSSDVYETIMDLVFQNRSHQHSLYGKSLISSYIPSNRTCKDAAIPEHLCVCKKMRKK